MVTRQEGLAQSRDPILVVAIRVLDVQRAHRVLTPRVAAMLERRARNAIVKCHPLLRRDDIMIHDAGSDVFVVLLEGTGRPQRDDDPLPQHGRSLVRRIEGRLAQLTPLEAECGWTYARGLATVEDFDRLVDEALARGRRERERMDFFSSVGHEMRSPLTSIIGYLEDVIHAASIESRERRSLDIVRREATRLIGFVDGMLDLSLIGLDNPRVRKPASKLGDVLTAASDASLIIARDRNVAVELGPIDPGMTVALPDTVGEQLFVNLIGNAVKHGAIGGRIEISAHELDDFACIHIDDDGPGVPIADRERIFEPHVRIQTARSSGRGLGLAFVRAAAESVGGCVYVEDSPLGGARFVVRLPMGVATSSDADDWHDGIQPAIAG